MELSANITYLCMVKMFYSLSSSVALMNLHKLFLFVTVHKDSTSHVNVLFCHFITVLYFWTYILECWTKSNTSGHAIFKSLMFDLH